jgi:predicted NUDIX family NTP pyrophosphohydrolase
LPAKSGKLGQFSEADRGEWFFKVSYRKIVTAQLLKPFYKGGTMPGY